MVGGAREQVFGHSRIARLKSDKTFEVMKVPTRSFVRERESIKRGGANQGRNRNLNPGQPNKAVRMPKSIVKKCFLDPIGEKCQGFVRAVSRDVFGGKCESVTKCFTTVTKPPGCFAMSGNKPWRNYHRSYMIHLLCFQLLPR